MTGHEPGADACPLFVALLRAPDVASSGDWGPTIVDLMTSAHGRARQDAASVSGRLHELLAADHMGTRSALLGSIEARGGVVHGLTLLSMLEAFGGARSDPALAAAAALELAAVAPECLRCIVDDPASSETQARNLLLLLAADWALSAALSAATAVGVRQIEVFVGLNREVWDAEALFRRGGQDPRRSPRHYLDTIVRRHAAMLSFAARLGARLGGGGASDVASAGAFGEQLGIALRVAEEMACYMRRSSHAAEDLRASLERGSCGLLLLNALAEEGEHGRAARNAVARGDVSAVIACVRVGRSLSDARRACDEHVARACETLVTLGLDDDAFLRVLTGFPLARLDALRAKDHDLDSA